MTQVLHLLTTEADFQSRRGADALKRDPDGGFCAEIKTIGPGGTWRSAFFSITALRNARYDVVHAWDYSSLRAAVFAKCSKIAFTPPSLPTTRQADWLRILFRRRNISLICSSKFALQSWMAAGVSAVRYHFIRPAVDVEPSPRTRNPALRAALGFSETDHVALAIGESIIAARHDLSVWGVSIAHVVDRRQKILLWGRGRTWRGAVRVAIRLGESPLFSIAETKLGRRVEFDELCTAADMALLTADGAVPTLPIGLCMVNGLPILATPGPIASEILEDGVTGKIVPCMPRRIARGIEELRVSSGLQQTLSANSISRAKDLFAMDRFLAEHRQVYTTI